MIPSYTNNSACLCTTVHTSVELGEQKEIFPNAVGLNYAMPRNLNPLSDELWQNLLLYIHPSIMRWPGGTDAMYWDAKNDIVFPKEAEDPLLQGWINPQHPEGIQKMVNNSTQHYNTIQSLYDGHTIWPFTVFFVLNLTSPGEDYYTVAWGRTIHSHPGSLNMADDWWLMMFDRIARAKDMLARAFALGISIEYIELGNEYYNGGPTYYSEAFPDLGATYPIAANYWASELKVIYPDVKIGAVATQLRDGEPTSKRRTGWNNMVLSGIDNNVIDAMIVHCYPRSLAYSFATKSLFWNNAARMASLALKSFNTTSELRDAGWKIWWSEFAPRPNSIYDFVWGNVMMCIWLHIFYLKDPNVDFIMFHQFSRLLTDNGELNGQGVTVGMFNNTVKGMNQMTKLIFSTPFINVSPLNILEGATFTDGTITKAIVLNFNDKSYKIPFKKIFNSENLLTVDSYSGTISSTALPALLSVNYQFSVITLPPYSVSLIYETI